MNDVLVQSSHSYELQQWDCNTGNSGKSSTTGMNTCECTPFAAVCLALSIRDVLTCDEQPLTRLVQYTVYRKEGLMNQIDGEPTPEQLRAAFHRYITAQADVYQQAIR